MTYYAKNAFLTDAEMEVNARYIYTELTARGWSPQAVCGMLGNMETESTINPAIWQNLDEGNVSLGYGLVQWTPSTKYTGWCNARGYDPATMEAALARIEWELENGEQYYPTANHPLTFAEFKVSTASPAYLALAFLANYERPAEPNQPQRAEQATRWYNLLAGSGGSGGDDSGEGGGGNTSPSKPIKNKPLPLLLILAATRRR